MKTVQELHNQVEVDIFVSAANIREYLAEHLTEIREVMETARNQEKSLNPIAEYMRLGFLPLVDPQLQVVFGYLDLVTGQAKTQNHREMTDRELVRMFISTPQSLDVTLMSKIVNSKL